MDLIVIAAVVFLASGVTLFSGFGLGTVLMPAFALFLPVPIAIAATAVVHLANNIFKLALVGRKADWGVVLRFSIPAVLAAIVGARPLFLFADLPPVGAYEWNGHRFEIVWLKLAIGLLIVFFAALEVIPRFQDISFSPRLLPAGGLLSGFFGGLSGNQGAFRSAFLIKAGLDKDAFVGTSVVSTAIVDIARLGVYGASFYATQLSGLNSDVVAPVLVGAGCAFFGAWLGARLLKKVTLRFVQVSVAAAMLVVGAAIAAGIV
jgi:uncharacterized membrane protein YfcA